MAPGEAELRELDRAAVERMNSLRKQAEIGFMFPDGVHRGKIG
jgi:hypothetical protein